MKEKGNIAEARVISELVSEGQTILTPFGDNEPYDLVVDDGEFTRVQVKFGRFEEGSVKAELRRTNMTGDGVNHSEYTKDDIDVYAIFSPETDEVYWVPFEDTGKTSVSLRVEEENAKFANREIKWAEEYSVHEML